MLRAQEQAYLAGYNARPCIYSRSQPLLYKAYMQGEKDRREGKEIVWKDTPQGRYSKFRQEQREKKMKSSITVRRNNKKSNLIAECVGACYEHYYNEIHEKNIVCLANLLWAIARGTRWEEDARSGIEGVCPEFFKDDTE